MLIFNNLRKYQDFQNIQNISALHYVFPTSRNLFRTLSFYCSIRYCPERLQAPSGAFIFIVLALYRRRIFIFGGETSFIDTEIPTGCRLYSVITADRDRARDRPTFTNTLRSSICTEISAFNTAN